MLETETKVWLVGGTVVITIPSDVVNDSAFPFKINIFGYSKIHIKEWLLIEIFNKSIKNIRSH